MASTCFRFFLVGSFVFIIVLFPFSIFFFILTSPSFGFWLAWRWWQHLFNQFNKFLNDWHFKT
ncbi:hypothetical protein OIU74_020862 [Salix koriyanagi]|uniref:Uncharacterized protein n=1 Tax=Salix koriyanagi TaxID=2511006 RepID=A0A9Q0P6Y0_9ROSI|nr:hypothetical protein OIU74_020862 [Salix koriyanagi]